jgi:ribonuclease HI
MDQHDADRLRELEESLWRPATRFDPATMERLLHPDFTEFGASGRTSSRTDILDTPEVPFDTRLPLPDFEVHELTDDVVLLTYLSDVDYGGFVVTANRTSIWIRTSGGWQLRHHQGTPTPTAPPRTSAPHRDENVF